MRVLFLFLIPALHSVPILAAPSSPEVPISVPVVAARDLTISVEHNKVAAGGISDAAHRTSFSILVRDRNGRPIAGVPVELPTLWRESGPVENTKPPHDGPPSPQVFWNGPTALTDAQGQAHGIFISGGQSEEISLRLAGGAQATISQVWNEDKVPWNHPPFENVDKPNRVQYEMSFWRDEAHKNQVMISGHTLKLQITFVKFQTFDSGPDDFEWKIEAPDEKATPEEKERWNIILSWTKIEGMRETAPGIYEGSYIVQVPEGGFVFGDRHIQKEMGTGYEVEDQNAW